MLKSFKPAMGETKCEFKRKAVAQAESMPKVINPDKLCTAVSAVMNTSVLTEAGRVLDADVVSAMRGMFPPDKTYRFDLASYTTISSSTGGVLLNTVVISPAITSYQEWPALSVLFDEVNLVTSKCIFIPYIGSNGAMLAVAGGAPAIVGMVVCGPNFDNLNTNPTGIAAVIRLAGSTNITRTVADRGTTVVTLTPKGRPYAVTTAPSPANPPGGCLGTFDIAGSMLVTPSTLYYGVVLRSVMVFRNRS